MNKPDPIQKMIVAFKKLPGVGPKMAERLSYHLLKSTKAEVDSLLEAINNARETIKLCSSCYNMSEEDPCPVCADSLRDTSMICVVETPQDLLAVSKVKNYAGRYFVLGGALSPLDAIGPDDIRVNELIKRLKKDKIRPVPFSRIRWPAGKKRIRPY